MIYIRVFILYTSGTNLFNLVLERLSCYGIMMRCSLLFLTGQSCNDYHYKIPLQVINSGINPIAYAFFKRDIQQECKRLLFKRRR